jgi:hypothetical protein
VTVNLDGTLNYQVASGVDVGSFADTLYFLENGSFSSGGTPTGIQAEIVGLTNPNGGSTTVHLSFSSQTQVTLGEVLQYRAAIRNIGVGVTQESIVADYAHTADFTISPTNGGSYTTASGLSYDATPEPSTVLLLAAGICSFAIWPKMRRRNS